MRIDQVNPLVSIPERRRFGRIRVAEPRACHIHLPQSKELWTERGILMNISLGGIYLVCDKQPPLEENDIRFVTLGAPNADTDNYDFGFHVLVVRTEHWHRSLPQFAVALRILSDPILYPLQETEQRECAPLDKPRMMYQYYDLNKKAYEIISNTPEIRPERIKYIQRFIERGSYQVKSEKVTQSVINDLFMEKMLLQKK
jgi:Anti-sigma-28 factor, FlgM